MDNVTERKTELLKCAEALECQSCGKRFIFRRIRFSDTEHPISQVPKYCYYCNKAMRKARQKEKEAEENRRWLERSRKDHQAFLEQLPKWRVVSYTQVAPSENQTLYIIGNGFDLMHGVRSSYYSFRDSLGKNSKLRSALENFWTPEDIWADFENALAQFNMSGMGSRDIVDMWLDLFDACNEDAGMAEFYMAAEAAANPILTVTNELPERFQKWVDTLTLGANDRPLRGMFKRGKVLCFNYTEFVETIYDIPGENVCYIHGCRKRRKGERKRELILGHQPGASDDAFDLVDGRSSRRRKTYRSALTDIAQEEVFRLVAEADDALTKHSVDIIEKHRDFFGNLNEIRDVVVIGHSLSPVDWDYFRAVFDGLKDPNAVNWFFGCHGLRDIKSIGRMVNELGIPRERITIFRTDEIEVTPIPQLEAKKGVAKGIHYKRIRQISSDGRWKAQTEDRKLSIIDISNNRTCVEISFPEVINNVFFPSSSKCLFAILRGADSGVFLFNLVDGEWRFVDELKGILHQGIMNRRLRQVFLRDNRLTFAYNNRLRIYDLTDGRLIQNLQIKDAGKRTYDGENLSEYFVYAR